MIELIYFYSIIIKAKPSEILHFAFCILHSAFKREAFPLIPNYALRIPNYNFSTISLVSLAIASSSFVGTTNALTGQPGNVSSTSSP